MNCLVIYEIATYLPFVVFSTDMRIQMIKYNEGGAAYLMSSSRLDCGRSRSAKKGLTAANKVFLLSD